MSPIFILSCIAAYFGILLLIAWYTSRNATNDSYFLGNKASPWYVVAFGMIGDSLSGVTFISVPGSVGKDQFSYFQVVLGYALGYAVIAVILLPLYYRLNLTSIYTYLGTRFGPAAQKSGAGFFLVSRTMGAAARLYLTASIIQMFVFDSWGVPFGVSVAAIITLILAYTYKGGIKTLVWTDSFQSTFLLLGVVLSIGAIMHQLHLNLGDLVQTVRESPYSRIFFWDWRQPSYFWKQFLSGAFIAVVMTGLDQNMMQKNLSCRSLRDAQKNICCFSVVSVGVNLLFLSLGALLYTFATQKGLELPTLTDRLFPTLALEQHLGGFAAVVFIIGLTAATFNSADSVLTTLTTSFCIDFLGVDQRSDISDAQKTRLRHITHLIFAVILLFVILAFRLINSDAVITAVLKLAGYTYGPLLGLFAFGLFCSRPVRDQFVPIVCVVSPALCYSLDSNSAQWFHGYRFGFELLMLNGAITALGLLLLSRPPVRQPSTQ